LAIKYTNIFFCKTLQNLRLAQQKWTWICCPAIAGAPWTSSTVARCLHTYVHMYIRYESRFFSQNCSFKGERQGAYPTKRNFSNSTKLLTTMWIFLQISENRSKQSCIIICKSSLVYFTSILQNNRLKMVVKTCAARKYG
jgi:hypothetical protein